VIDTHRTITKSSVARLNPEPRRPADAGALFHVEEQDKQTFREAVYTTLPRVGQPRPTTDYDSLKQKLAANKDVPPFSSKGFDLLLASSAAYQHPQVTGVPLQASLVNSQEADTNISNSQGLWRTAYREWHCSRSDAEVQQASTWSRDQHPQRQDQNIQGKRQRGLSARAAVQSRPGASAVGYLQPARPPLEPV